MKLRKRFGALMVLVGMLMALMPLAGAHTDSEAHTDLDWSSEMNQESHWETYIEDNYDQINVSCTKYGQDEGKGNHDGTLPAEYEFGAVKAGQKVAFYDARNLGTFIMENPQNPDDNPSWVMKCNSEDAPPPTDYCDYSQRPGGTGVESWVPTDVDCVDFEVKDACGAIEVTFTNKITNYSANNFTVAMNEGSESYDLNTAQFSTTGFTFPEDYNGGSVTAYLYVVGSEKGWLAGHGVPNYWDQNAVEVTVDTDCEDEIVEACIDINTATLEELTLLKGVDEVIGQRIIDGRPFGTIAGLGSVSGINVNGPSYADLLQSDLPDHPGFISEDCLTVKATTTTTQPTTTTTVAATSTTVKDTTSTTEATTTTTEEDTEETLPFTGPTASMGVLVGLGLSLIASGGLLLALRRKETS